MVVAFYIPTRYPNGLPSGIPAEAFSRSKAEEVLRLAEDALKVLEELIESK